MLVARYFSICPFALKFIKCADRYSKAINFVKTRYDKLCEVRMIRLNELYEYLDKMILRNSDRYKIRSTDIRAGVLE